MMGGRRSLAIAGLLWAGTLFAPTGPAATELRLHISWGCHSPAGRPFTVALAGESITIADAQGVGLEAGEGLQNGFWRTECGDGDIDGLTVALHYGDQPVRTPQKLNSIWRDLIAQSDPETARRLTSDAGYRRDRRKLTVLLDRDGQRGFSLSVDQLLQQEAFWIPSLDVYVATGDSPRPFAAHQKSLEPLRGKLILDQVRRDPEATLADYTERWEDMGSPRYTHPSQPAPGHIIGLTWDSAIAKFGIDRGAGVWNDYGNPDKLRLWFDFGDLAGLAGRWRSQTLRDGLPIVTTVFQRDGIRYEVEQFAFPLDGPPTERRGDMPMVLLSRLRVSNDEAQNKSVNIVLNHRREFPIDDEIHLALARLDGAIVLEDSTSGDSLVSVQTIGTTGAALEVQSERARSAQVQVARLRLSFDLPGRGSRDFLVKLPSPLLPATGRDSLLRLDFDASLKATAGFWTDHLARGAQFRVPEKAVNDLFRASLWHALRLPRRHGGEELGVKIDLPYSNFAYDQQGAPWPVNQAVYVDYMLYDLRGYHDFSAEELLSIYRSNQQADGRVGGYANWGVYTPSMIYSSAQHFLLSQNRESFEQLLPATLKALDWCLAEIDRAEKVDGPGKGLVRAPLNDLTSEGVWAFNQAYFYAGLDALAQALERIDHPRAAECRQAAARFQQSVKTGFARASVAAPLVQLRDGTWSPYVPSDVARPRRLFDEWYPTDVDTGAVHLVRLKALDYHSPLADALLHDHEDNLYLHGWGMANEPVYNQQATAYLLRDDVPAAIRAFYSYMACAFSHAALEPVEHRWTWGQYFGPPSTDGAWFDLYRHMLIHELDDDRLLLAQAVPRSWLAHGERIEIERAPTWYGPLSFRVESRIAAGQIIAEVDMAAAPRPKTLLVRLRHPDGKPIRYATVNGVPWPHFDPARQWIEIPEPSAGHYALVAYYD